MPCGELLCRRIKSGVVAEWITARGEGGADRNWEAVVWSAGQLGGVWVGVRALEGRGSSEHSRGPGLKT